MNLCCEADPTNLTGSNLNSQRLARRAKPMDGWSNGKSQGCDLQSNSLQQERNQCLVTRDNE